MNFKPILSDQTKNSNNETESGGKTESTPHIPILTKKTVKFGLV